MTRKLCDCCRSEIEESTEHGVVRVPVQLYEHLAGRSSSKPTRKKKTDSEAGLTFFMFAEGPRTIDLDVCEECLRRFVDLRERMQDAAKEGLLQ